MMVDLEEKVSQLENWTDGKGLIVQGAAGTFCSGSDLNAVRAISNPQVGEAEFNISSISGASAYLYLCSSACFDSWDFNIW